MTLTRASALRGVRSIMETPILDEHKWAKIPSFAADAFLLDLEDSVPIAGKDRARAKLAEQLRSPEFFGGRVLLARGNPLDTPWGLDDFRALGEARAPIVVCPKVRHVDDVRTIQGILRSTGADPELVVLIEMAQAVLEVNEIAQVDGVSAVLFGPSDLSVDAGFELWDGDRLSGVLQYPRTAMMLAAAAHGLQLYDSPFVADFRDLDAVRAHALASRRSGFHGLVTFYPPHIEVINDVYSVAEEEVLGARRVVAAYEAALDRGEPAVILDDGRVLIVQDYKRAQAVLARAGG
jgi:citrate lyase beta subunit